MDRCRKSQETFPGRRERTFPLPSSPSIEAAASRISEHVDASVMRTVLSSMASESQESTAVSSGEPKAHIFLGRNCLCLQPGLTSLRLGLTVGAPGLVAHGAPSVRRPRECKGTAGMAPLARPTCCLPARRRCYRT